MKSRFNSVLLCGGVLLQPGCDPSPAPAPALTPDQREEVITDRKRLRNEQATSLIDIELTVPEQPIGTETYFQVQGVCRTKDRAVFRESPIWLQAEIVNPDGVIEWTKALEIKEQDGNYAYTGELRSPPRPGTYEVRLIYPGADVGTLASAPLTVGPAE
jgi:hypothetical protein